MVDLYWPRDARFRDTRRSFLAEGEGVYDIPDDAEDQYRSRGWEDPPDDADDTDAGGTSGDDESFDEDAWMEPGYQQREAAVLDGRVDEHLDAIEAAETSETVKEAVEERRAELEE